MKKITGISIAVMLILMNLISLCNVVSVCAAETELKIVVEGGDDVYDLDNLEEGSAYTLKALYGGELLTGAELDKVELKWDPDASVVDIRKQNKGEYLELSLHSKNVMDPKFIRSGRYAVVIHAYYTPEGGTEKTSSDELVYVIGEESAQGGTGTTKVRSWFKWFLLLLMAFCVFALVNGGIKVTRKKLHADDDLSSFQVGTDDVTENSTITAEIIGERLCVYAKYGRVYVDIDIFVHSFKHWNLSRIFKRKLSGLIEQLYVGSNAVIEAINVDGITFTCNERNVATNDDYVDEIDLKEGSYIKFFGTMPLNGNAEPFMVTIELAN